MRFAIILITILLMGCIKRQNELEILKVDNVSGETIWELIKFNQPYKKYSYMPEHEGLLPGQSPHGLLHKIYVNDTFLNSLPNSSKVAPYGSVIIKENYTINEEIDKITVMVKVKGYNPTAGDWFWAAFSNNGDILAEGTLTGCITCHSGMEDNDYIIVKQLDH